MNTPETGSAPVQRLFFAFLPEPAASEALASAAQALQLPSPARLVPRNNLHVTLAFVGAVATSQVALARQVGAAQRAARFTLRFDALEYWPKPEVVVAAARSIPPPLQALWQALHRDLAVHGWAVDAKRLRPHVTLARKVVPEPMLPRFTDIDWTVRAWCLMRSDTSADQSAYTVVDTWQLLDNAPQA